MKKKIMWIGVSLLGTLLSVLLWIIGLTLYHRISASHLIWSYFSCSLTGKEQNMVNCDQRSKDFSLSGNELSFVSQELFNAVYIPFTADTIKLQIDSETKASYEFYVLYDTFGWKELQRASNEVILDTSPEQLEMSLVGRLNNNFFFEKDEEGRKIITIDTKKPILTQQGIGHLDFIKNTSLVQGKNAKGVIMLMMVPEAGHKVFLKKIDSNN